MAYLLRLLSSALLVLMGAVIGGAWLVNQAWLGQFSPNHIIMVFNAALCFVLAGGALMMSGRRNTLGAKIIGFMCGFFICLLAALSAAQDIFGLSLGIDHLFVVVTTDDYNAHPGRMALPTSLCFLLSGVSLMLLQAKRSAAGNVAIQTMAISVMGAGILGVAGAYVRLELLYDWYQYGRMAIPTAVGFLWLSASIWLAWYAQEAGDGAYLANEEQRIGATGIMIIAGVTITAGMSGFGLLASEMEQNLEAGLRESFASHSSLVRNDIESSITSSEPITTRILLNKYLSIFDKNPSDEAARQIITEDAQTFLMGDITGIAIYSDTGAVVTEVGTFLNDPQIAIPLFMHPDQQATLLWKDDATLRIKLGIVVAGEELGSAVIERRLPNIKALLLRKDLLGETAETRVCSALNEMKMQCLPSYRRPAIAGTEPRVYAAKATSMDGALRGKSGINIAYDYLHNRVIAAYGPLGDSGLGIVVKINTAEFYGPLRDKLNIAIVLLALLSLIGVLAQRLQLLPLVARLVQSEQRVKTIMDNVADGIITIDERGIIQSVNPAIFAMFGYTKEAVVGQNIQMLMPASMRTAHETGMNRFIAGGANHVVGKGALELPARHADGHEFTILLTVSEMRLHDGRFFIGSMRDITERKRLETLKSEFVATVSHELRTPLTSIRGSLGLVVGDVVGSIPEKAKHLLDIAYKNCERLIVLINDILEIEKMESGELHFSREWIDVRSLLEEAMELNKGYAVKHNVTFVGKTTFPRTKIFIDASRFTQIMSNLLSNAAKFSPPGAIVEISAEETEGRVRVSVRDYGQGIPLDFQARIFDKFAQADSSDAKAKGGTGLGLNIAKTMTEQMGGTISFMSQYGDGSIFVIEFPCERGDAVMHDERPLPKERVLICGSDRDLAEILRSQFDEKHIGYEVVGSYDEVQKRLKVCRYLALILDLSSSGADAPDCFERLRSDVDTAALPVIVISTDVDDPQRTFRGAALNVIDWLQKPIDPTRLTSAILRACRQNEKPIILHVEDDDDISHIISIRLKDLAYVVQAPTLETAEYALAQQKFDVILLDITLPDGSGLKLLEGLNGVNMPLPPVIIFSATDVPRATAARVAAALVKSKTSEEDLVATIAAFIP